MATNAPMTSSGRIPRAFAQFRRQPRTRTRVALAPLCGLIALGCASYPARTEKALNDFQGGHLQRAIEAYEDSETVGSEFLCGAEAGTVALAAGDWDRALANLNRAAAEVEEIEHRALVSPETFREDLISWAINESASPYQGEGYERVMLHTGLAMAYLAKGDLTAAQVEVRRANALLENEEQLYDKEYAAGGLGHFLSAVSYELDGKFDDAYIDYKRMEAKGVGAELAGRALVRLAKRLHFQDDLRTWTERYGEEPPRPEHAASVVVVAGIGLGPYKREFSLTIPTFDGILQWSVPTFIERPQVVDSVALSVAGGDKSVRTVVIEDVARVARENLEDRIAWLATKSAIRSVLKRELTQELAEEAGIWGLIAGDVFAFVSERADLRAWQTLPDTWQAARVFLPAGTHELTLSPSAGDSCVLGTFELESGETMFVFARTIGHRLFAYPVGGRRIDSTPDPAIPRS